MTNEEKQLLLIDLCARLPYGVKVRYAMGDGTYIDCGTDQISIASKCIGIFKLNTQKIVWRDIEYVKPYLRPMSSMTAEEEYEYHQCKNIDYLEICEMEHTEMLETTTLCFSRATDWLNKKGFDYRGLIPIGLAIEAPEGMYE